MPIVTQAPSSGDNLARALGEAGEQEYAQLLRLLTATQGMFALVPVASDFPVEARAQLLERLAKDLTTRGMTLHVVSLTRERWNVLQALADSAPCTDTPAVLALVGIEDTPGLVPEPGAPARRPPALALLNHTREGIRAQCPFPLLLWCTPEVFVALQEHAPDFYDHFVGLTEFLYAGPRVSLSERPEVAPGVRQDAEPTSTTPGQPGSPATVAFYTDLLTRHPEPSEARARALLGRAEALWALRTVDLNTRLMQALEATEEALSILTLSTTPEHVARGQVLKGLLLSDFPTVNRAANLRQAIACYEAALRVRTEAAFPIDWAMTQNNLGIAYQDLPSGDRAANLRQAIACYEAALRVRTEAAFPIQWATIQNNLGTAYQNLPSGDRAANLRQAIACYEAALRVRTEAAFPIQWAMTQNNLGTAYQDLPSGDRAANLRQAIACYEAAIRGYEATGLTAEVTRLRQYIASLQQPPSAQGIGAYVTRVKNFLASLRKRLGG